MYFKSRYEMYYIQGDDINWKCLEWLLKNLFRNYIIKFSARTVLTIGIWFTEKILIKNSSDFRHQLWRGMALWQSKIVEKIAKTTFLAKKRMFWHLSYIYRGPKCSTFSMPIFFIIIFNDLNCRKLLTFSDVNH